jgi:hypothetical protein
MPNPFKLEANMSTEMKPPEDLAERGQAFWRNVVNRYELSVIELELVLEVARSLDLIEDLYRTGGSPAELRMQRLAVGRLLGQLAVPVEDTIDSPMTARARKAAATRWNRPAVVADRRRATR